MTNYIIQTTPTVIQTTDEKRIEEHFGLASTNQGEYSLAHMTVPPGWSEPPQKPEFDEITIVIAGRRKAIVNGKDLTLHPRETLWVKSGSTVQYSNPFAEPVDYWSVCIPAVSPEKANRINE